MSKNGRNIREKVMALLRAPDYRPRDRKEIAQALGAIVAAIILWLIASGKPGWAAAGFAANGYGDLSPGKYGLGSCFVDEIVMTFFFLFIIIGTTSKGAAAGFAGIPATGSPTAD